MNQRRKAPVISNNHPRMLLRATFFSAIALISACELHAATVTVTNTNDNLAGSLRQAIVDANAGDTIVFDIPRSGSGYDAASGTWTIGLTSGELRIERDVTIDGGSGRIRVQRIGPASANPQFRVFRVASGNVNISRLTIANGYGQWEGAGVYNTATLTLTSCTIVGNFSITDAGGVLNEGTLTMVNCTVTANRTRGFTAGVRNDGTLAVRNCTIVGNQGDSGGGGTGLRSSGNIGSSPVRVRNTVIARNTGGFPPERDVAGAFISEGYNFIGVRDGGSGFPGLRDQSGTDSFPANPQLADLADNGRPVPTMAPLSGSPLLDRGGSGTADDARGLPRPIDNPATPNAPEGDGSDVGAVEIDLPQTAPNFVVTTTDEHIDGTCGIGDCSFWDAVNASNANAGSDSVITFASHVRGTIDVTLQNGGMFVVRPVVINGPGAGALTLNARGLGRHFNVQSFNVVIAGLTIAHGQFSGNGGAITAAIGLTVRDCVFLNNKVVGGFATGGALMSSGETVRVTDCTFSGNSAAFAGGAAGSVGGTMIVERSTFAGNTSGAIGGAIRNIGTGASATLLVENSTFAGNSADASGGAIGNFGSGGNTAAATVTNCTFSGNAAPTGGAIHNHNDNNGVVTLELRNTILRTGASGSNLSNTNGTITSGGNNLSNDAAGGDAGTGPGGFLSAAGDRRNTDPRLDPAGLRDHGGATQTIALLADSPAINAANPQHAPERDQRRSVRAGAPDIGAFEFLPPEPNSPPTRFANISTRMRVETGENVLIGGFIVTGAAQKRIMIRALGPSLPVDDRLSNPVLELYDANAQLIRANDNWQQAPNAQEINDSTIAPPNELESAILRNVNPGAYTALVRDAADGAGVGLVELYDLGSTQDSKLANISTRGRVLTGDNVMIGGLIITGSQAQKVIIRAIGPSLPIAGKLEDPVLDLFDGNGNPMASNNDWKDTQQSEIEATSIPPTNDLESAIVTSLPPAAYTAVVRGVNDTTGVAVVEAYALD